MTNKPMLSVERQCKECGSKSLSWDTHSKTTSGVAEGRLRSSEVQCFFVLGCNECSETIMVVDADRVAGELNKVRALLDKPVERVIDLDALDWESVKEAAAESKWMPPEYMRNEWVADVCEFLRAGPAAQHHGDPVAWQYRVSAGPATGWSLWHDGKGEEFKNSYQVETRPLYAEQPAPVAVQISWSDVEPWYLANEQRLSDIRKFEGSKGFALEVWRGARLNGVKP